MRNLLIVVIAAASAIALTQIASAADMPVKAPVYKAPVVMPVFSWTGFYIGVNGGCGWSKSPTPSNYAVDGAEDNGLFTSATGNGCFGGGQIGYNYQFANNLVAGIEVDAVIANIKSSFNWTQPPNDPGGDYNTWESKLTAFGTVRARLGYAVGQWLPYITGGWAWARNKITSTCLSADVGLPPGSSCDSFTTDSVGILTTSDTQTHYGWVIGAGLEYALNRYWSVKGEYLHLDLASKRYNVQVDYDIGVLPGADSGRIRVDTVKLGLNYRPDWWR